MQDTFDKLILNFNPNSEKEFSKLALDIFKYQYINNSIYKAYSNILKKTPSNVTNIYEIPFLPIQFFKTKKVVSSILNTQLIFKSSGTTTDIRSSHYINNPDFYLKNAVNIFEKIYGSINNYSVLAILPSYLQNGDSSLVYMVNHFISLSKYKNSACYLNETDLLAKELVYNELNKIPTILIGVTYALLDFSELYKMSLTHTIVMETGGMKGKKKEMTRYEIHDILKTNFNLKQIHSEYGMTELLSQAYSQKEGIFEETNTLKILIREDTDPFNIFKSYNKKGALNIIDLANYETCSFISTDDIGYKLNKTQFIVEGRLDIAEVRGCSQLI